MKYLPLILLVMGYVILYALFITGYWDTVYMKDNGSQFSIICTGSNPELICGTDPTHSYLNCICNNYGG